MGKPVISNSIGDINAVANQQSDPEENRDQFEPNLAQFKATNDTTLAVVKLKEKVIIYNKPN